jgi:hypothetical protein
MKVVFKAIYSYILSSIVGLVLLNDLNRWIKIVLI